MLRGRATASLMGLLLFIAACSISPLLASDCRDLWRQGRAMLHNGLYQDATNFLKVASASCTEESEIHLDLARSYLMSGKLRDAESTLNGLLSFHPRMAAALKLKGDVYYLLGRDADAIAALQEAIRADPANEEAIYSLGRVYYQQSRAEQAREQFERVLALNPKSYRAHDNLALCFQALNQDEAALSHFKTALDLVHKDHPEYDWVYANLAEFLIAKGDYRRAFDLGVEAAQRNPGSGRNCYVTAKALSKLNQAEISVRWLLRAIQLEPEYPEPHYLLAQIYRAQGKSSESTTEFERFKELRQKVPAKLR